MPGLYYLDERVVWLPRKPRPWFTMEKRVEQVRGKVKVIDGDIMGTTGSFEMGNP